PREAHEVGALGGVEALERLQDADHAGRDQVVEGQVADLPARAARLAGDRANDTAHRRARLYAGGGTFDVELEGEVGLEHWAVLLMSQPYETFGTCARVLLSSRRSVSAKKCSET